MRGLLALAERAARTRCAAILATIKTAIAEHAPSAAVEIRDDLLRARGRGLKRRFISEAGLRFARRVKR
jgi:hypothetical protein